MAKLTGELFIDGLWLQGHGPIFESVQPVTGETIWDGESANLEDVDAAVREARNAFVKWQRKSFAERQAVVEAFGELLVRGPWVIDSLTMREASGGSDATCSATSIVFTIVCACGTSHCARPMRYASSALSGKPSASFIA